MGVGRSRRAALTLTVTGAGLLVLAAAASGHRAEVLQAPPTLPAKPQPCKTTVGGLVGVTRSGTAMPEPLCGTSGADRLTAVGGGDTIWGYQGRDTLRAKNAKPDLVFGGPDVDAGTFDRCDRVFEVEQATVDPAACPGVTQRSLAAPAAEQPLPRWSPVIECTTDPSGAWKVGFLREPRMRAIDATPEIDWQFLAWTPVLFRFDGTRWVESKTHKWLWDMTYDLQVTAFPGNFWRRFTDNERAFLKFVVTEPGTYRVAVRYHWYAGPDVPDRDAFIYATRHYGDFEDGTRRMCVFPEAADPGSPGS